MHWTEPTTSDDSHAALEKALWNAANPLWSTAVIIPSEYGQDQWAWGVQWKCAQRAREVRQLRKLPNQYVADSRR